MFARLFIAGATEALIRYAQIFHRPAPCGAAALYLPVVGRATRAARLVGSRDDRLTGGPAACLAVALVRGVEVAVCSGWRSVGVVAR